MDTKKAKSKAGVQAGFTIYLPGGKTRTVSGSVVSLDVRDGALLLLDGDKNGTHALPPGGWLAVNIDPR